MKNQFFSALANMMIVFVLFSFGNTISAQSTQAFYYHYDQKVMLNENPAQCVVAFSGEVTMENVQQLVQQIKGLKASTLYGPMRICRFELTGADTWAGINKRLLAIPGVHAVYPVYSTPEQKEIVMSSQIILQSRNAEKHQETLRKCKDIGLEVAETINMGESVPPFLVCETPRGRNPLDYANQMQQSGLTLFAHPNFAIHCRNSSTPNDPQYGSQWFLNQSSDKDIDAPEAWDMTKGSSSVVVAVIDGHGYELNHPDMIGKFVSPYDAVNDDNNPAPENQYANHGMPCAGLVGANTNNSTGVAGAGYNVKVLPIMIGFNTDSKGIFATDNIILSRAANRVISTAGVVAVSNSWATNIYYSSWEQAYSLMESNSRGGLGAAILASTGNDSINTIVYPSAYPFVVGIGASDYNDLRAPFSNFGNMLDVVAPGVNTLTIDRIGNAGYSNNDYMYFLGTSAACPIAAGVCGLIASVNPALEGWEIAEVLQYTAEKVGGYNYSVIPGKISTWNNEMGHGRINACRAVGLMFKPTVTISNITSNAALISWTSVGCAQSYAVSYRPTESNDWITVNVSTNSITLSNLQCYKDYAVKVRPDFSGDVQGTVSNTEYFTTLCGPPTNLTNVSVNATSATVSWTAAPCAFMYNVTISGPGLYQNFWTAATDMTFNNLQPSKPYVWRVRTVCTQWGAPTSGFVFKAFTTPAALTGGDEEGSDDREASASESKATYPSPVLYAPYPNPSNDFVTITYDLPENDFVRIDISNSNGEIVKSILSEDKDAGNWSEQVNVGGWAPGIYMVRLQTNQTIQSQRISVL